MAHARKPSFEGQGLTIHSGVNLLTQQALPRVLASQSNWMKNEKLQVKMIGEHVHFDFCPDSKCCLMDGSPDNLMNVWGHFERRIYYCKAQFYHNQCLFCFLFAAAILFSPYTHCPRMVAHSSSRFLEDVCKTEALCILPPI